MLGALLVPGPLLAGASGLLFGTATGFVVTLARVRRLGPARAGGGPRAGRGRFAGAAGERPLAAAAACAARHGVRGGAAAGARSSRTGRSITRSASRASASGRSCVGTLIGSAPRAFAYTALGDSLDDPASPLAVAAIAVVVLTGALGTVLALRLRRAT